MNTSTAFAPILSVPEMVFPDNEIDHKDAVTEVARLYEPLCAANPGDAEYQNDFAKEVKIGIRMAANLAIDAHPVHLQLGEMIRPRGLRARNAEAMDAFATYVPLAAKRALASSATAPATSTPCWWRPRR